jgi:hypothetical protein
MYFRAMRPPFCAQGHPQSHWTICQGLESSVPVRSIDFDPHTSRGQARFEAVRRPRVRCICGRPRIAESGYRRLAAPPWIAADVDLLHAVARTTSEASVG